MNRHVANSGFGRGRRSRSGSIRGAIVLTFVYLCTCAQLASAQVNVLTYHNDNARTGQNLAETVLTPATVNSTSFGKLFSYPVDGYVRPASARLERPDTRPGNSNVVYIATQHNSVYAFDADNSAIRSTLACELHRPGERCDDGSYGGCIHQRHRAGDRHHVNPGHRCRQRDALRRGEDQGDKTRQRPLRPAASCPRHCDRRRELDGPEVIADTIVTSGGEYVYVSGPTIPGTGDGNVVGQLSFNAFRQLNRPGLLLLNGVIYTAWGSHGDGFPMRLAAWT